MSPTCGPSIPNPAGTELLPMHTGTESLAGRLLTGTTDAEGRTVTYAYDNRDRTTKTTETVTDGNGGSHEASITYQYEKDRLPSIGHNGFFYTFTYDAYGKRTGTAAGGNTILTETYQPANGSVTGQAYANGDTASYVYNAREELESIFHNGTKAFMYQYDAGGNRTEERIYPYTTGTLGEPETTISYGYGAEGWKDQLSLLLYPEPPGGCCRDPGQRRKAGGGLPV